MKKEDSKIKLSVVIPAFNEEKFLPACLESLKKQKIDVSYEVIVVDNNSTDGTAKVAKKYGARVLYEPNKGVCFARQCGALQAKGDIIVSTDADCTFSTDWLKNIYRTFKNNTELIAVLGPYQNDLKPRWGRIYSSILFKTVKYFYSIKGKILYAAASNFAYRKNILMEIGGYNTALTQGGDEYDLLKKLRKKGLVLYLPENIVSTSSRRLKKGMIYSLFVTLIGYYILDYHVATKLTGKSLLGQWPDYRENKKSFHTSWIIDLTSFALILLLFLSFIFGTGKVYSKNRVISGSHKVASASKDGLIDVNQSRKYLKNHWYNYRHNYHPKVTN